MQKNSIKNPEKFRKTRKEIQIMHKNSEKFRKIQKTS
jgi:hypothetical protein